MRNFALCTEQEQKPLEGFGYRSDTIKLACDRDHPATLRGMERERADAGHREEAT